MDLTSLRRRTAQVDEQHRTAMATIGEDLAEAHVGGDAARVASRRRFLARAGTGAAVAIGGAIVPVGAMAAAAQESEGSGDEPTPETISAGDDAAEGPTRAAGDGCTAEPVEMTDDDLAVVHFAESVERAAVAAYEVALGAAVHPPAVAESMRTFQRHHTDHAEALYCLAGNEAPAEGDEEGDADQRQAPNAVLVAEVAPQIQSAGSSEEILEILYDLEESAAATYAFALGAIETIDVAGAAGQIGPVEAQHAVVWGQTLGKPIQEWMPALQTDAGAFSPAEAS